MRLHHRFRRDERGTTAIEYGLIAALFSIIMLGISTTTRGGVVAIYTSIVNAVTSAAASA